jgi:hypothetical protein
MGDRMPKNEEEYTSYFEHNKTIAQVLSLFAGFIFTSITLLLTRIDTHDVFAQATLLFLTILFDITLFVLINNLEMPFEYIKNIPTMTLKVRPFFYLLLIFYLFGATTVMMFLLYQLFYLSIISGMLWSIIVLVSILSTGKRFFEQSVKRDWNKREK